MTKMPKTPFKQFNNELHFTIELFKDGEWVAQCKEVSGIITGNDFLTDIKDATCAGFGIKEIPPNVKFIIKYVKRNA